MKPITLSPVSLVLGVLLAVGLFLVMGQAGPSSYGTWGPPKKGVVNVFHAPGATVPAGGHFVVYQVPNDRWLTITATDAHTTNCGCVDGPIGTLPCLRWAEFNGGVMMEKGLATNGSTLWYTPEGGGGAVGWVFRPGSQVVIRNIDTSPCALYDYSLIGYETRD